ncbi:MAG TPA: Ig-like domain-containing protein [Caulobacteraceae bacterium]|jgi:hypothetical protein
MTPAAKAVSLLAAASLALAACEPAPRAAAGPAAEPPQAAYLAPPEPTRAALQGGGLLIEGTGQPLARIRLARADGSAVGATVEADGRWRAVVPPPADVQLYSIAQDVDGRLVRAVGYLAVAPAGQAAMLRPGAGARVIGAAGASPAIRAVDYDAGGAAIVSASVAPNQPARLLLDGADAGEARGDAAGRLSVTLPGPVRGARHSVTLRTPAGAADAAFALAAPVITAPPSAATRLENGWRIDWMAPGGGVQSTVLFDRAGGAG